MSHTGSVGKQSTSTLKFILKPLTVFRRISSKIELSRLASELAEAWSTDAQINISNFNIFFLPNRFALTMTTNNNKVEIYFHNDHWLMHCAAEKKNIEWEERNHFAVWSLSNPSFFLWHRLFDERVDARTDSMLMIANRCCTYSYKKTFRLPVQIFTRDRLRQRIARFGKGVKRWASGVSCAVILGEGELHLRGGKACHVPRMDPTRHGRKETIANNNEIRETMLLKKV